MVAPAPESQQSALAEREEALVQQSLHPAVADQKVIEYPVAIPSVLGKDVEAFVRGKRIGAWRKLMGLFNAGRAYWITDQYRPENEAEMPQRNSLSDRIFVIPTNEEAAIARDTYLLTTGQEL